jgi:hypothetical protein
MSESWEIERKNTPENILHVALHGPMASSPRTANYTTQVNKLNAVTAFSNKHYQTRTLIPKQGDAYTVPTCN